MTDVLTHAYDLAKEYLSTERPKPFATGLKNLDKALNGGLFPGTLNIIGGRPGEGKTTLALQVGFEMAKAGGRVLFISLEMSQQELIERLLCARLERSQTELRFMQDSGVLEKASTNFLDELKTSFLHIVDDKGADLNGIKALLKEKEEAGEPSPQLLIVDHLQMVWLPETQQRTDAIATYLRELKELAKERGMAVIVCSQINRSVYAQKGNTPAAHNLKSSGAIEELADLVLLGYRKNLDQDLDEVGAMKDVEYEIKIAKHRRGPMTHLTMLFRPPCFTFLEPMGTWEPKTAGGADGGETTDDGGEL